MGQILGLLWKLVGVFRWMGSAGSGLTLLGWLNPVWGALVSIAQLVWWGIKSFIQGTLGFMQRPVELFSVFVIGCVLLGVGVRLGINWDKHLVQKAQDKLASVVTQVNGKDQEDARRAAAAVEARRKAEAEERARQADEAATAKAPASVVPPLGLLATAPTAAAVPHASGVQSVPAAASAVHRRKHQPSVLESVQADIAGAFGIKKW